MVLLGGVTLAILFVGVLSSTSFIYDQWYPVDSTIYQIIGKGWLEGKIPYVDLWDQKGPLLYFINAFGYWLTGDKLGLFIIEICIYAYFFYLLYAFYRRSCSRKMTVLLFCLTVFHLSQLVAGGNTIEQYILPLLMLAYMYIWEWSAHANSKDFVYHSPAYAFLYGVILSASLLTRLTNAIGVCLAFGLILCYLLKKKEWRGVGYNFLTFLLGFYVLTIPFYAYFYAHDGLYEWFYATILFNMDYLGQSSITEWSVYELVSKLLAYIGTYGLVVISALLCLIDRKQVWFHGFWLIVSSLTLLFFLRTVMFEHYAIIAVPYFAIMLLEFKKLYELYRQIPFINKSMQCMASLFVLLMVANFSYQLYQSYIRGKAINPLLAIYQKEIVQNLDIDTSNLIGYGVHPSIYLHFGVTPVCRFFALQESYSKASSSLRPKVVASFEDAKPSFVLLRTTGTSNILIEKLLFEYYTEVENLTSGSLFVYKGKH